MRPLSLLLPAAIAGLLSGCIRAPSPLTPHFDGSIGLPSRGTLSHPANLASEAKGLRWLRNDAKHFGVPRFVASIERAAAEVARERPGSDLSVGDLSLEHGGVLMPHFSHRSGRDADLLFYATTLDGVPTRSPGFVSFDSDGLARDDAHHRFIRFDVEREWLLVKALLSDPDARIQWFFINHKMRDMVLEWASARGEPAELIAKARTVMLEPHPGGAHDDHLHARTDCSPDERATGCEMGGPTRPWLDANPAPESPEDVKSLPMVEIEPRSPWLALWTTP